MQTVPFLKTSSCAETNNEEDYHTQAKLIDKYDVNKIPLDEGNSKVSNYDYNYYLILLSCGKLAMDGFPKPILNSDGHTGNFTNSILPCSVFV